MRGYYLTGPLKTRVLIFLEKLTNLVVISCENQEMRVLLQASQHADLPFDVSRPDLPSQFFKN